MWRSFFFLFFFRGGASTTEVIPRSLHLGGDPKTHGDQDVPAQSQPQINKFILKKKVVLVDMKKPNEDGRLFHLKKSSVCLHTPQSRIFTLFSEAGFYCSHCHLSQDFWSKFYNLCQSDNSGCSHILQLLSVVLGTFFFFLITVAAYIFHLLLYNSQEAQCTFPKSIFIVLKFSCLDFLSNLFYIYI